MQFETNENLKLIFYTPNFNLLQEMILEIENYCGPLFKFKKGEFITINNIEYKIEDIENKFLFNKPILNIKIYKV